MRLAILFHAMPPIARWASVASFSCDTLPPLKACLRIAIGHFYGKKWGCSSDRGQGCDLGNCIAKTLRFCIWKATKSLASQSPPTVWALWVLNSEKIESGKSLLGSPALGPWRVQKEFAPNSEQSPKRVRTLEISGAGDSGRLSPDLFGVFCGFQAEGPGRLCVGS